MASKQITLGHKVWTIRPLTLKQVQAIEPVLLAGDGKGVVGTALAILRVALSRDFPEDANCLEDFETTTDEISLAMGDILQLGGFLRSPMPGEASAGESPAPIGVGSIRA
ncbi:hypothetical protein [Beijerinckia indica]|nr:hypothetical protein [Beijerinckia indica]